MKLLTQLCIVTECNIINNTLTVVGRQDMRANLDSSRTQLNQPSSELTSVIKNKSI